MIVTPYFAKLTGIKFGKICLSPPSRCRGVHGQGKTINVGAYISKDFNSNFNSPAPNSAKIIA